MFPIIYYEKRTEHDPFTQSLFKRFSQTPKVAIERYQELFMRRGQNFRIQKQGPCLILAHKEGNLLWKTPPTFSIGSARNFYFSHMLNCIYDCRYCFLQGMFPSGNYVIFTNLEEIFDAIAQEILDHGPAFFFSGYDCDSLALEPLTQFCQQSLAFFKKYPEGTLEIRTKSTQIQHLLKTEPIDNAIIAYTLNPSQLAAQHEHRAPSTSRRIAALEKLSRKGWKLGLRFDPLLWDQSFSLQYGTLIEQVFEKISPHAIHSVTIGALRFPKAMHKKIEKLYPQEPLLHLGLQEKQGEISYIDEQEMKNFVLHKVLEHIEQKKIFVY